MGSNDLESNDLGTNKWDRMIERMIRNFQHTRKKGGGGSTTTFDVFFRRLPFFNENE